MKRTIFLFGATLALILFPSNKSESVEGLAVQNIVVIIEPTVVITMTNMEFDTDDFGVDPVTNYVTAEKTTQYCYTNTTNDEIKQILAILFNTLPPTWYFTVSLTEVTSPVTGSTTGTPVNPGIPLDVFTSLPLLINLDYSFIGEGDLTLKIEIQDEDEFVESNTGNYLIQYTTAPYS